MTGDAPIDGGRARLAGLRKMSVDSDVWRDRPLPQILDELAHVIGFVGAERDATAARPAIQHLERRFPFGGAAGLGHATIHRQSVAVLHHGVADVAKPGRLAVTLLV